MELSQNQSGHGCKNEDFRSFRELKRRTLYSVVKTGKYLYLSVKCSHHHHHHHWQGSHFSALTFLRRFCQIASGYHFLDILTIFAQNKVATSRPTANLEDQVPVFMCPSDRVAQLCPQTPSSLFVTSYNQQGYGGGDFTSKLSMNAQYSILFSAVYDNNVGLQMNGSRDSSVGIATDYGLDD
jgi:hypothetical protein